MWTAAEATGYVVLVGLTENVSAPQGSQHQVNCKVTSPGDFDLINFTDGKRQVQDVEMTWKNLRLQHVVHLSG